MVASLVIAETVEGWCGFFILFLVFLAACWQLTDACHEHRALKNKCTNLCQASVLLQNQVAEMKQHVNHEKNIMRNDGIDLPAELAQLQEQFNGIKQHIAHEKSILKDDGNTLHHDLDLLWTKLAELEQHGNHENNILRNDGNNLCQELRQLQKQVAEMKRLLAGGSQASRNHHTPIVRIVDPDSDKAISLPDVQNQSSSRSELAMSTQEGWMSHWVVVPNMGCGVHKNGAKSVRLVKALTGNHDLEPHSRECIDHHCRLHKWGASNSNQHAWYLHHLNGLVAFRAVNKRAYLSFSGSRVTLNSTPRFFKIKVLEEG